MKVLPFLPVSVVGPAYSFFGRAAYRCGERCCLGFCRCRRRLLDRADGFDCRGGLLGGGRRACGAEASASFLERGNADSWDG